MNNGQNSLSVITHREMGEEDIPFLLPMQDEGELFWSEEIFLSESKNPISHNPVALVDGNRVGFACLWLVEDMAEIHNIFVASEQRGRGIGKSLIGELLIISASGGANRIFLEVSASNHAARRLYERCGFSVVGSRKGYYKNGEAIIMSQGLVR